MKSTGIIRKVDDLGRIVLPIELRRTLDIAERDELEIFMEKPAAKPMMIQWRSFRQWFYGMIRCWGFTTATANAPMLTLM